MNWNRLIIQNVGSLGVLQMTNYLVPVLVIPLLLARVGLESYGMIVLAQGIMNVAVAITDFGLNLTGTRLISQAKGDLSLERTLTQKILVIKIVLLLGTFIGLVFLVKTVSPWQPYEYLILTSYFIVIGNTLMPVWYFQGIQKMTWLALLNFLSRVFYVGAVLFFIESNDDLLWVNVCNGLGWCIAAFCGWGVLFVKTKFRFEKQSFKAIYAFAYQNVPIFLSEGVTTFYRNIGIVIAGFFLSAPLMGIYVIIDRIMMLIANSYTLVYRAIFPMLCNFVKKSDRFLRDFLYSIFSKLLVMVLLGMAVVIFFGGPLIEMLSDEIILTDIRPFLWILPVFIFLLFCNLPISLLIIALDMKKMYFGYHLIGLITALVLLPFLISFLEINGLLISIALAELAMFLFGAAVLYRTYRMPINP